MSRGPRHPALVGLVANFWVSARPNGGGQETILPSGRAQVVIDGGDVPLVVGPRTRPSVIRPSPFSAGFSLGGGGLHALTRVPVDELLDRVVDAGEVWGRARWQRCLDTGQPSEILDRLEHAALGHLHVDGDLDRTVIAAETAIRGGAEPGAVAAMLGVDRRRLVPAFRRAVGLAPKHYQRIVRFQRSLRAMRTTTPAPLATIAAGLGYADQAHLSREFKEFSGLTPSQLHGAASPAINHVATEPRSGQSSRRHASP